MQKFEMFVTMNWLAGKVKGNTAGYRNVGSVQSVHSVQDGECAYCQHIYKTSGLRRTWTWDRHQQGLQRNI
jgi:hypothetical protein